VVASVLCFHGAFHVSWATVLIIGYLGFLMELRRLPTPRSAFYAGLLVGLGIYVPPMAFLGSVFGPAAVVLWGILALFHAVFVLVLHRVETLAGTAWALGLAPVVWCGLEYFRSEVWWLRFAWLTAGSVFVDAPRSWLGTFGVYGLGGLVTAMASGLWMLFRPPLRRSGLWIGSAVTVAAVASIAIAGFRSPNREGMERRVRVAGIQLESPGVPEVLVALDGLVRSDAGVELIQLSEYTFEAEVPTAIRSWCRQHRRWLVAGGREEIPGNGGSPVPAGAALQVGSAQEGGRFFNTAFVVDPNGDVCFQQAKSRPIQFFRDGEPAPTQRLWDSPWGKWGVAICYDASYRRVMDVLVRLGAEGLLIPTMDLETWGGTEHELNARMARIRALEYGVPVFRVASSGVSLILDREGRTLASAPFPGPGATLLSSVALRTGGGSVPWDAVVAPICLVLTGLLIVGLLVQPFLKARRVPSTLATDSQSPTVS
jgi:apolipoprotein N-acyltransferase